MRRHIGKGAVVINEFARTSGLPPMSRLQIYSCRLPHRSVVVNAIASSSARRATRDAYKEKARCAVSALPKFSID